MTHGTGDAIGPYEVLRPLGRSDAAPTAWLARGRSDPSALVVLRVSGRAAGPGRLADASERGDDPRQPGAGRRHPNVLHQVDTVHLGSDVTVVTEFAAGGSLRRRLAAGLLDVGETITVLAGVASALAHWHGHGEAHGALHPGRVLFHLDGRPVVDAFGGGAARPAFPPGYASPEVARGHRAEPSDDVFALGSIALQCLAGKPAWPADELRDVVIQSVFGQWPAAPDGIPRALAELLTQMLDRESAGRPAAAEIFRRLADCGRPAPVRLLGVPDPPGERPGVRLGSGEQDRAADPAVPGADQAEQAVDPAERAADSAQPARGASSSAELQREWLTDSASVAEWLRAAVRRPVPAPAAGAADERTAEAGDTGAPDRPARLYDRAVVRTMAAVVAALAVLAGVWLTAIPAGDSSFGSAETPSTASSAPEPGRGAEAPMDWLPVLSRLDGLRAQAFHTADVNLLAEVYAPESPTFQTDARRIGELAAAGYHLPMISHDIRSATEVAVDRAGPGAQGADGDPPVTLTVEQAMPAFEIHDSAGGLVGHTIEQPPGRSIVTLVHRAGTYRILSVTDAP